MPDVYQGSELWNLSLVDPDNRRPVDFAHRRSALEALRRRGDTSPELATELVSQFVDGRIKLHVTHVGLRARREMPALFLEGSYEPLESSEHVVAFQRSLHNRRLVCVVPRFSARRTGGERPWALGDVWGDEKLNLGRAGTYRNAFTGEKLAGSELHLADVLARFPVAWLLEVST